MSEVNVALVQSMYAAYARGDIATILGSLTPDVGWHTIGRKEDFPAFGPRRGVPAAQEFFKTVAQEIEFSEFTPREFYCDRDKVFVLGRYAMAVKKTGRKVASEWVHIFTFRGGRVAQFHEFLDTAQLANAYGDRA